MIPKNRRVLRLPAVRAKVSLCTDTIYRGEREGWFPRHIKLTERASGWFEDEIDEYLAKRAAERDSAKPTDAASTPLPVRARRRAGQRPAAA